MLNQLYEPVHMLTAVGFTLITLLIGTAEHSAFDFFSQLFSARYHDEHHLKATVNFGSLGIHGLDPWDTIHGTECGPRIFTLRNQVKDELLQPSDTGSTSNFLSVYI